MCTTTCRVAPAIRGKQGGMMDAKKAARTVATVLVYAWLAFASVVTIRAIADRKQQPETGGQIYIMEVRKIKEYDGTDTLLLTYSLSGAIQSYAFSHATTLEAYLEYLGTIGTINHANTVEQSGARL